MLVQVKLTLSKLNVHHCQMEIITEISLMFTALMPVYRHKTNGVFDLSPRSK